MRISDWSSDVCSSDLEKLSDALAEFVGKPFLIDTRSLEKEVEVQVQLPDGVLHVELPRRRLFSSTTYVFILWMVGTSLILFAVATVFMRKQVRPIGRLADAAEAFGRSEEHTSELQSLMRISYAVFCLKKKNKNKLHHEHQNSDQNEIMLKR